MTDRLEPSAPARDESTTRALLVVFVVALTCATLVSATALWLEPAREAHRVAEREAFLRGLVESVPGMSELLGESTGQLEARVLDFATGEDAPADAATIAAVAAEGEGAVAIPKALDLARIGRRPTRAVVYLLERQGVPTLIVLPLSGRGYGGVMRGYLALEGDADLVVALTIVEHEETPGFGARVTEPAWLEQWRGKRLRGDEGELLLRVARGQVEAGSAAARHEVDAITGATRTSRAVTKMLHYWLGEHGFGPFLDRLRAGRGGP